LVPYNKDNIIYLYLHEIVKDIENVCKSMGIKRREIENIKFASYG